MKSLFTSRNFKNIIDHVSNKKGAGLLLISSMITYVIITLSSNTNMILTYGVSTDIFGWILYYPFDVHFTRLAVTIVVSFLAGINILLITRNLTFQSISAAPGAFLGIAFTGCPACTAGVIYFFGISMGSSILPYGGFEFNILSVILLTLSALYISSREIKDSCKI